MPEFDGILASPIIERRELLKIHIYHQQIITVIIIIIIIILIKEKKQKKQLCYASAMPKPM